MIDKVVMDILEKQQILWYLSWYGIAEQFNRDQILFYEIWNFCQVLSFKSCFVHSGTRQAWLKLRLNMSNTVISYPFQTK